MSGETKVGNFFQRHAEKVIPSGLIGVLGFVALGLFEMSGTLQVVLNRLDNIDVKMTALDVRFERYQTKDQAKAEKDTQALRDQIIHDRIDQIRNSLKTIDHRLER